jgi:hypothetical protein
VFHLEEEELILKSFYLVNPCYGSLHRVVGCARM